MKELIKTAIIFSSLTLLFSSCNSAARLEQAKQELLEVDIEFSRQSVENGVNKSFLAYISDDCVLLRPHRQPVKGKDKIVEMFSKPDSSFTLSWTPLFADVAMSGDLGYTYGIYKTEMVTADGSPSTSEGTYVSIWKKGADGNWKFVLDTGNQGLGNNSGNED